MYWAVTFGTPIANSEVRNSTTAGVLKLTLHATGYDWKFVPVAGSTFTDFWVGNLLVTDRDFLPAAQVVEIALSAT